jgi:hypothetical protein
MGRRCGFLLVVVSAVGLLGPGVGVAAQGKEHSVGDALFRFRGLHPIDGGGNLDGQGEGYVCREPYRIFPAGYCLQRVVGRIHVTPPPPEHGATYPVTISGQFSAPVARPGSDAAKLRKRIGSKCYANLKIEAQLAVGISPTKHYSTKKTRTKTDSSGHFSVTVQYTPRVKGEIYTGVFYAPALSRSPTDLRPLGVKYQGKPFYCSSSHHLSRKDQNTEEAT